MRKIFPLFAFLYCCTLHAQNDVKMLSIWSNGEMIFQTRYDSIDSITFAVSKPLPVVVENMEDKMFEEKKLSGLFSVSPTKKVRFSSGNLQYQASTDTWRFALNQYDIVGDSVYGNVYIEGIKCDNNRASATYDGWIDEFAKWTSGFDNTSEDSLAIRFHPWDRDTSAVYVNHERGYRNYGYGPSIGDKNLGQETEDSIYYLRGKYANYDWGVYNPISNGGNKAGLWRTLGFNEWFYLIHERKNDIRGYAVVDGIKGLVLFPDDWADSQDLPAFVIRADTCTENTFNIEEWIRLENAGAVFLPCYKSEWGEYHVLEKGGVVDIMPSMSGTAGFVNDIIPDSPFTRANVRLVQDVTPQEP